MKILVACEYSGRTRDAFAALGHEAWSCDLLPTEIPGNHYRGDVRDILSNDWDLLIAHPPCTYLANAGLHYLKTKPERVRQLEDAFEFVLSLWNSPINQICIENPVGWLNTHWRKPSQKIQPYYFGEKELKTTCLWLKNLPPLWFTGVTEKPKPNGYVVRKSGKAIGKKYNYYWRQSKSAHDRSRTFNGIARAMAEQWSAQ